MIIHKLAYGLGGLAFVLVCCVSCKDKSTETISKDFQTVPIQDYKTHQLRYADFISMIDTIPLQTQDYFMGQAKDWCISDSLMYILDNANAVWCFKYPSGEFVNRILRIGHGHGEYISLSAIATKDSLLYLLDTETRSVLTYNQTLQYKKRMNIDFLAEDFTRTKDGFLFFNSVKTDDLGYFVHTDEDGHTQNNYVPAEIEIDTWFGDRVFMENGEEIYMSAPYTGKTYRWTGAEPELVFSADFGDDSRASSHTKGSEICQSGKAIATTFFVTDQYFISSFLQKQESPQESWKRYYSFYNIKNHTSISGYIDPKETTPFCPSWQYNGTLIGICNTDELPDWNHQDSILHESVLFVYHLK